MCIRDSILIYPMTTGRNFDEVLRVIDSLQLTAKHKVATPVNWQQGDKVIIAGSVSNEEAKETYPDGWEEPRPYIRICLLYTSDAADDLLCVDLGGRRIIKKKKSQHKLNKKHHTPTLLHENQHSTQNTNT